MAFEINVQTRRPAVNVEIPGSLEFGINGATFYPAVSEDGILSWTNDRGLPNPDPVKVSGKDGENGSPGNDGLPGEDGITPHVGSNGNWFLGSADTGVPATGLAGERGLPGIPGEDGKSAYDYAQEAGYTGTEADFAEKLAQEPSGSGIHIGTEAPTDPNVDVWIDTDEEAPENENGIDVIAEVGQTIVVEAVDADGKPTEWKAVDFPEAPQPDMEAAEGEPGHILNRTHWRDVTKTVLLEKTVTPVDGFYAVGGESIPLVLGDSYTVVWDGSSYECVAKSGEFQGYVTVGIGNQAFIGGENTGENFLIANIEGMGWGVMAVSGEHTFKIIGNEYTYHTIPSEYIEGSKPYYIDLESDNIEIVYSTTAKQTDVWSAVLSGYQVVVRRANPNVNLFDYFTLAWTDNAKGLYFYRLLDFGMAYAYYDWLEFRPNDQGGYDIAHKEIHLLKEDSLPTALKNPYALTINGTSYDGSKAVNIESIKGDKGDTGQRGTGLLAVTSAPSSYTTSVGGITPKYRMALSTIKTQSGVTEVLLGDTIRSSYYHYPIAYLDASYAYCTTRTSIRGATGAAGAAGADGADGKSAYAYAQDGGYTGTEAEFAEKLAAEYAGISWSETGEVVVLPETEFTFANNQSMRTGYLEIVPGNTYTVSFDGTKYQCVAFKAQLPGNSYYIPIYGLGNAAIMGGGANTGEPFLFISAPTSNVVAVIASDTKTVHTVGVTYIGTKYVPIPDGCIGKDYIVNITEVASNVYMADKTAKEVAQAAFSGKNVYAIHRRDASNGNTYRRYTLCEMITTEPEDGAGEKCIVGFIGLDFSKMQVLRMEADEDGADRITIAAVTI